ncbi:MAG: hypothetical protein AAB455_03740 [Patescibacteria group bacterium]
MNLLSRLKPEFALRLTLAAMYLYSGYSLITSPKSWTQFVPYWLKEALTNVGFSVDLFLQVQGAVEIFIAIIFLIWFAPKRLVKWLALISTLEMAFILIFGRLDLTTFRDLGLIGAFFALFLIYARK